MVENGKDYKIKGYTNKWSVVDRFKGYVQMENNTYGDETCYLVIREDLQEHMVEYTKRNGSKVVLPTLKPQVVYETFDDIETCLSDEGVI